MSLHILQNRIDTFTKSRRNKASSKSTNNLKWPHPSHYKATPQKLAEAGFFFDPSPGDKDSVTCYMCNKQLSEWAEEDDPFEIHFEKCGKKCGWASVKCGFVEDKDGTDGFAFKDKNRLPTSKAMEKARLLTFIWEDQWPHDKANYQSVNSKSMARAGFIYVPTEQGDDAVECMYCDVSLSGWNKEDDPTEEHRKRAKALCPMFPDIGTGSLKASTSKSKSKQKSIHMEVLMPTKDYDGQDDEEVPTAQKMTSTSKTPRKPKSTARGAKTPAARARSTSRSRQVPVDEEEEEEEEEEDPSRGVTPAPPPKSQKKPTTTHKRTRSRSKSAAPPQTDTDEDAVTARATRTRGKSKGIGETESDDQSSKAKPQRVRSKSKARVSVIPEDDAAEREDVKDDEEEPNLARKAKGKETKGNAKVATSVPAETPDDDPAPRTRKTSKAPKPDSTTASKAAQLESSGTSTSKKPSNHKRTASSTSKGKSRAIPLQAVESDNESDMRVEDIQPTTQLPPPAKNKTTKPKPKSNLAASRVEQEMDLDTEVVDSADPLDLVPPPSKTRPPSRSKVKALASRYESEEPPAPKPHKPQQPSHTTDNNNAVRLPSQRAAAAVKSASSKPASAHERNPSHSRSGSDWERREVDMELQLVEISSNEEDENGVKTPSPKKPKRKVKKMTTQEEEEKENKRGEVEQPKEKERVEVQHNVHEAIDLRKMDTHADDRPLLKKSDSKEKRVEETVEHDPMPPIKDVEMADSQDEFPPVGVQIPVGRPVTPPIVSMTPSFPPKTPFIPGTKGQTNVPPTPGVQFFPPLSKEPFVNLETLSNEELDMTVEEWIRYQMGIEYEKFRKDGENELAAFQKRADEVRRTIEAL
ncbi:hypothetical protein E1B28_007857 [Marasmius oreades]|uniref:BIR-domain-containing protein n=1 Tax=Marasmius oreades TaxID=181124 RepID=A0A9P7S363_9AGAR|nr:uncharacterized protein E1B28_007857 [Marasmius oreades]KAG7094252.1 hypothetical protein E1B28_007857 [Marasmius oreades]